MSDKVQKQNKEFTGIWIPKEILKMEDLGWIEKIFLSVITSLTTAEKGCTASNIYFANLFNISKKRASEIVTTLSRKERIGIEYIRDTLTMEIRIRVCTPIGIPIPKKVKEIDKGIEKSKNKKVNISKRESNSPSISIDDFLEQIEFLKIKYKGYDYEDAIENFTDYWTQPLMKNPEQVLFQDNKAWKTGYQFEKWIKNEKN